ncbi:MAG: hypothetical protein ACWGHO_02710 [Candidatus Moraniibacteriota bacterium]
MENNLSKLDKLMKLSMIVGVLIMALSVAYYLVIFMPQKERARIEQQGQEKEARINNLNKCLEKNRESQLNNNLGFIEMQKAGKINNADVNNMIDENNKSSQEGRSECFKKYPQ